MYKMQPNMTQASIAAARIVWHVKQTYHCEVLPHDVVAVSLIGLLDVKLLQLEGGLTALLAAVRAESSAVREQTVCSDIGKCVRQAGSTGSTF
jgi:hypothetical protein